MIANLGLNETTKKETVSSLRFVFTGGYSGLTRVLHLQKRVGCCNSPTVLDQNNLVTKKRVMNQNGFGAECIQLRLK